MIPGDGALARAPQLNPQPKAEVGRSPGQHVQEGGVLAVGWGAMVDHFDRQPEIRTAIFEARGSSEISEAFLRPRIEGFIREHIQRR